LVSWSDICRYNHANKVQAWRNQPGKGREDLLTAELYCHNGRHWSGRRKQLIRDEGRGIGRRTETRQIEIYRFAGPGASFTAAQLDRLAQDPSDDSVFCVDAVCNDTQKELAHRYFKTPTDVRQLLALDPFILGISTDQHPERFAPACTSAGSCAAPLRLTVDNQPVTGGPAVIVSADHAQANPADPSQAGDTGVEQNVVLSSGLDGPGIGTLSISYRDVTASPDFADRSASIVLRNSSHCERGDVDIWFDKAFGAFLWNARMTNACRP